MKPPVGSMFDLLSEMKMNIRTLKSTQVYMPKTLHHVVLSFASEADFPIDSLLGDIFVSSDAIVVAQNRGDPANLYKGAPGSPLTIADALAWSP